MRINGNTYTAEVTKEDRLRVDSASHTPGHIAAEFQDAYTIYFAQDSGAVTSDFFYLKNTSDRNLVVDEIRLFTPTLDVQVSITTGVTGTPTSGTAIVPINMFTGGKAARVVCEGRDGDMALTGGNVLDVLFLDKDFIGQQSWKFSTPIIMPPDTAMVLNNDIDPTADIDGTVFFYFEND